MAIGFDSPRMGASGASGGYLIENSALFDTGDYLTQTMSAGNRKTFTIEWWAKRHNITAHKQVIQKNDGSGNEFGVAFPADDKLLVTVTIGGTLHNLDADFIRRDTAGYSHHCIQVDTTQVIETDRVKYILNGVPQTLTPQTTWPPLNSDTWWNHTTTTAYISRYYASDALHYHASVASFRNVDGDATVCSGEFDAEGYWNPSKYTGAYTGNSCHLDFSNGADLGEDSSGLGNHWTVNGTITQVADSPTDSIDGVNANYATLNPLDKYGSNVSLSNANKTSSASSTSNNRGAKATLMPLMPIYFEVKLTSTSSGNNGGVGLSNPNNMGMVGETADSVRWMDAAYIRQGAAQSVHGTQPGVNGTIRVAYHPADGKAWFGNQSVGWFGDGDPVTGANPSATGLADNLIPCSYHYNWTIVEEFRFAEDEWDYEAPEGFVALATQNMPEVLDGDPSKHWANVLYTGTPAAQSITGVGFQPDFTWIKARGGTQWHHWFDSVRGADRRIHSNSTGAESSTADSVLVSFDTDGFSLPVGTNLNGNGASYVAWCASLTNLVTSGWSGGTITPTTERYNATLGMSISTYTATGVDGTVPVKCSEVLGQAPFMTVVKRTDGTGDWFVIHEAFSSVGYMTLNGTGAFVSSSVPWNGQFPSSSVVGVSSGLVVTGDYIMINFYKTDFCKPLNYIGNGNADGTFVNLGISPEFFLGKNSNLASTSWVLYDDIRDAANPITQRLYADATATETTMGTPPLDFVSNGVKMRSTTGDTNASGNTFIGIAIGRPTQGGSDKRSQARGR